jgi:hypothetical protein
MCSINDDVIEGIIKYSLAPYADQNNIELSKLIDQLSDYHYKSMIEKQPKKLKIKPNTKRGRPSGSTNKDKPKLKSKKNNDVNGGSSEVAVKRPRGRPKGSTNKKHNDVDVGI